MVLFKEFKLDFYLDKYADLIISSALKLRKGDVLSINTEEENSEFAHLLALKAAKITGNGSFINYIKDGKVEDVEETATEYPINRKPTALLYIPSYKSYPDAEEGKSYSAPELQSYRLLSEPLSNQIPSIPYATAYMPSDTWSSVFGDDYELSSFSNISELFSLEEDMPERIIEENSRILRYEREKLNRLSLVRGRLYSDDGVDISLEFLPGSSFEITEEMTSDGRSFVPTLFSSEIFRALDKTKTNGYVNITKPMMLFGHVINSLSIVFENGKVREFSCYEENGKLFNDFIAQDQNAAYASELILAENSGSAASIDFFALPEWDRMRGTGLVLGGARGKGLSDEALEKANDSLVYLYLPLSSSSLTFAAEDKDGNEYTVLEDGMITEEE